MNVVTNTWRQLLRRRLWPVALLLVAALAATPVLLAREPERVAPPADPVPATGKDDALAEPVVAKVAAEDRAKRRRVLGARKDPFEPAPVKKQPEKEQAAGSKAKAPSAGKGTGGTPASPAPSVTTPSTGLPVFPVAPGAVVTEPKPKPKSYPAGSLIVRFGDANEASLERMVLRKLDPLPDDEAPLLVYTGLTKKHKKAIFLIDDAVTPDGDGTCKPHPSSCETIELAKGETEFFDVTDPETGAVTATFQLDLVAIND